MAESTATEILKSSLVSIIRYFLAIIAAYLIKKGLVSADIASEQNLLVLAGGLATAVITLGWMLYTKLKTRNLIQAAQEAPAGTSMNTIKANAAEKPLTGS